MLQQLDDRRAQPVVREYSGAESADLVYFSSVSENTRRFVERVERVGREALRIPLRPRLEGRIRVTRPFVLMTPTYGSGLRSGAIPQQVKAFLNDPANRALLRGVITGSNTNFGEDYCLAGALISAKCGVPEMYRFELLGTPRDVEQVAGGLERFWREFACATPGAASEHATAELALPSHVTLRKA